MQNVNATIVFSLNSAKGEQVHKTTLEYANLDEGSVLMLEKHMIGFLSALHADSVERAAEK